MGQNKKEVIITLIVSVLLSSLSFCEASIIMVEKLANKKANIKYTNGNVNSVIAHNVSAIIYKAESQNDALYRKLNPAKKQYAKRNMIFGSII